MAVTFRIAPNRDPRSTLLSVIPVDGGPLVAQGEGHAASHDVGVLPRQKRSQFVFTSRGGRELIFWQTSRTVTGARPGVRIPGRRASGQDESTIVIDSRERSPYRFASQQAGTAREPLAAGSLGFLAAELATLDHAAVVVEGRYSDLFDHEHVTPGFVLGLLAGFQVHYPSVPVTSCGTRKLAEEWTFRFLGAARAEAVGELE